MVDFLTLGFFQRSLMAAALTGGVCAAIGVFVVLRGLAFIGAGTAHAAFAGVALAYLVGGPPMPFAIAFGLGTAWITGLLEPSSPRSSSSSPSIRRWPKRQGCRRGASSSCC